MTNNEPYKMDEEALDGEVIYVHEKSLEEVLGEITGKDPEEIERRVDEMPMPDLDELVPVRKE